jgi:anti-sigma regulatory factor (Ser/Thr protein kinase)
MTGLSLTTWSDVDGPLKSFAGPGPLEIRVPPAAPEVSAVRRALWGWLVAVAVPADEADDVVTVASELVTNGVVHAGDGDIILRALVGDGYVALEVVTVGADSLQPALSGESGPLADSGRGLSIVVGLACHVRLVVDETRWVVRCRIPVPARSVQRRVR